MNEELKNKIESVKKEEIDGILTSTLEVKEPISKTKLRAPLLIYPAEGIILGGILVWLLISTGPFWLPFSWLEGFNLLFPIILIEFVCIIGGFIVGIVKYKKRIKQFSPEQLRTFSTNKKDDNLFIILIGVFSIFSGFFNPFLFIFAILLTIFSVKNLKKGFLIITIAFFLGIFISYGLNKYGQYQYYSEINNTIKFCTDSDGGRNYDKIGYVLTKSNGVPNIDYCWANGRLEEFYCDGDSLKSETHTCPNGCDHGACVTNSSVSK